MKTVGIFRRIHVAAVGSDFELIGKIVHRAEIDLKESAFVKPGHLPAGNAVAADNFDCLRMRPESADKNVFTAFVAMDAEHRKNIAVIAVDNGFHLFC